MTVAGGGGASSPGFGDRCGSRADPRPPHCVVASPGHPAPGGGGDRTAPWPPHHLGPPCLGACPTCSLALGWVPLAHMALVACGPGALTLRILPGPGGLICSRDARPVPGPASPSLPSSDPRFPGLYEDGVSLWSLGRKASRTWTLRPQAVRQGSLSPCPYVSFPGGHGVLGSWEFG